MDVYLKLSFIMENKNFFHENFVYYYRDKTLIMPVPALQKRAPDFRGTAVVNGEFKDISLSDYHGKYLVLFFYPLDLYVF